MVLSSMGEKHTKAGHQPHKTQQVRSLFEALFELFIPSLAPTQGWVLLTKAEILCDEGREIPHRVNSPDCVLHGKGKNCCSSRLAHDIKISSFPFKALKCYTHCTPNEDLFCRTDFVLALVQRREVNFGPEQKVDGIGQYKRNEELGTCNSHSARSNLKAAATPLLLLRKVGGRGCNSRGTESSSREVIVSLYITWVTWNTESSFGHRVFKT